MTDILKNSLICIILFLSFSHILVLFLAEINKNKDFTNLKLRMKSWWIMLAFLAFIFMGNKAIALSFVGIMCFLALKEYFSFIHFNQEDRKLLFWAYLSIPIQMSFLYINWIEMFYLFVPLYMLLIIPLRKIFTGETKNFVRTTGLIQWGMLLMVYSLGYLGAFLILPLQSSLSRGEVVGAQLLLFLLIINTLNDAAQYTWGKLFGKKKIIPSISPNKTWAGFIGGIITTTILSVILAKYLTPMGLKSSIAVGIIISVFGFLGDVVMSAVKRDVGVKDSSTLIPGHGGILDRVDSLTYTAPLFFHFFCYFYQVALAC